MNVTDRVFSYLERGKNNHKNQSLRYDALTTILTGYKGTYDA